LAEKKLGSKMRKEKQGRRDKRGGKEAVCRTQKKSLGKKQKKKRGEEKQKKRET